MWGLERRDKAASISLGVGNGGRVILGKKNEQLHEVICKISESVKMKLATSLHNLNRKKTTNKQICDQGRNVTSNL